MKMCGDLIWSHNFKDKFRYLLKNHLEQIMLNDTITK